jgi:hypothetical protein
MSKVTWTSDGFGEEEPYSTDAIGEEEPTYSTDAIGEEDPVTKPWYEEPWYSTDALGEEGPVEPVIESATVKNPFGAF